MTEENLEQSAESRLVRSPVSLASKKAISCSQGSCMRQGSRGGEWGGGMEDSECRTRFYVRFELGSGEVDGT